MIGTNITPADVLYMDEALAEAIAAESRGEVPVGAVVVHEAEIIARAHNLRESLKDPTAHAEMRALQEAARVLERWRLTGTTLYVTLEPCFMCAGALVHARIDRLVYATRDPKGGAVTSLAAICTDERLNHRLRVDEGAGQEEAAALLRAFFRARRGSR